VDKLNIDRFAISSPATAGLFIRGTARIGAARRWQLTFTGEREQSQRRQFNPGARTDPGKIVGVSPKNTLRFLLHVIL
jgi:hypothetical protein